MNNAPALKRRGDETEAPGQRSQKRGKTGEEAGAGETAPHVVERRNEGSSNLKTVTRTQDVITVNGNPTSTGDRDGNGEDVSEGMDELTIVYKLRSCMLLNPSESRRELI